MKLEVNEGASIVLVVLFICATVCLVAYFVYAGHTTFVPDDWVEACGRYLDGDKQAQCIEAAKGTWVGQR